MDHQFDIVDVHPVTLAVTEVMTKQSEIPSRIIGMFDIVYAWLNHSVVKQSGHNYAIYDRFTPQGMRMRVGFPVSARFADDGAVQCMELEGGRAAHFTHIGPYNRIPIVHVKLNAWCAAQSLALAGMSWELYGDWQQDESKLVTDIYFRLK